MNSLYSKKEREGDEAPFAHIPLWGLQIRGVVKIHTSCQWQSQRLGGRSPPSLPLTHFKFIYFETVLLCSTQVGLELKIPLLPPSEFWDHRCVRPCSACPLSSFLAFLVYLTKLDFISIIYLSNIQRALDGGVFLAFTETLRGATSPVSSSQHPKLRISSKKPYGECFCFTIAFLSLYYEFFDQFWFLPHRSSSVSSPELQLPLDKQLTRSVCLPQQSGLGAMSLFLLLKALGHRAELTLISSVLAV